MRSGLRALRVLAITTTLMLCATGCSSGGGSKSASSQASNESAPSSVAATSMAATTATTNPTISVGAHGLVTCRTEDGSAVITIIDPRSGRALGSHAFEGGKACGPQYFSSDYRTMATTIDTKSQTLAAFISISGEKQIISTVAPDKPGVFEHEASQEEQPEITHPENVAYWVQRKNGPFGVATFLTRAIRGTATHEAGVGDMLNASAYVHGQYVVLNEDASIIPGPPGSKTYVDAGAICPAQSPGIIDARLLNTESHDGPGCHRLDTGQMPYVNIEGVVEDGKVLISGQDDPSGSQSLFVATVGSVESDGRLATSIKQIMPSTSREVKFLLFSPDRHQLLISVDGMAWTVPVSGGVPTAVGDGSLIAQQVIDWI